VAMAKNGTLKLQNVWFSNMTVTGSDANKIYVDELYDATNKAVLDASKPSYSTTYFLAQTGNAVKDLSTLMLTDGASVGANYMPLAGSPLLTAATFTDNLLTSFFTKVSYIGAFAANDNWMTGWTNFDPNNTDY
jgi:hypothetical protein